MSPLPADVQELLSDGSAPGEAPGAHIASQLEQLRAREPAVNREMGEGLLVFARRRSHSGRLLHWELEIVGEDTGIRHGAWDVQLWGEHVRDIPLDALALSLRIALNHPADLPDSVFVCYAELTGWEGFECDRCQEMFPTWRACVRHEHERHGVPLPG